MWLRIERERPPGPGWAERCAALYVRRHPGLVELVDYGVLGRAGWFEAFRTQGRIRRWPTGGRRANRTLQAVATFLRGQGLTPGALRQARIVEVAGEPRILPDDQTGFPLEERDAGDAAGSTLSRPSTSLTDSGIVLQVRTTVDRIIDFLDEPRASRARWLQVRAPIGSGISTTLRLVAREVRLKGFLPLAGSLVAHLETGDRPGLALRALLPHVTCRHLVVLNDRHDVACRANDADAYKRGGADPSAHLVSAILELRAALPHSAITVVSVSDRETSCSWVTLDPLRTDQLLSMVGCRVNGRHRASLFRAAQGSCGWPGRFVKRAGLIPSTNEVAVARERAPRFGPASPEREDTRPADRTADLDAWRCFCDGRALFERGRHAAAARAFRAALGMFERRDDALHAGQASYELGQLLFRRGIVEDASHFFAQAGRHFRQAGVVDRAIAAAAAEGTARIDAGELRVAEGILQTAEIASLEIGAHQELIALRAALVRCLQLLGKTDEAVRLVERDRVVLQTVEKTQIGGVVRHGRVQWYCAAASLALQRRAYEDASTHVTSAVSASKDGAAVSKCAAHQVALSLSALIGDAEAVQLHAASALEAAQLAHAPIEALRVRLAVVAALGDVGAIEESRTAAAQLLRRRSRHIPPLLSAQRGLVLARALPDSTIAHALGEEAEAFARLSGASGLLGDMKPTRRLPQPLDDIVDLLTITHEYEDEDTLLREMAAFLRARLGALTVALYAAEDLESPIVSAGSGRGVAVVRAVRASMLLGPLRTCAGIEMAAPIRCGRTTIAGLGCRWSAAGPSVIAHAQTLLATAAAMCSPFCRAALDRRRAAPTAEVCSELLGGSQVIGHLRRSIIRAAAAPFPVLIVGESGVGKELVARAIHRESPRRMRNFAALNCAALTEDLVEAELFGHARGAFTGAIAERRGLFEEADGGTLFLDEVSELSLRAQAKLLRVLQEGEVRRVGESFARHVDVRVVAATNRCLEEAGTAPTFRQDLRYRLDVIRLEVPPLRERIEDIPILATAFWVRVAPLTACRARLSPATLAALACHDWPGNVRELQNVMTALAVAAPRRGVVSPSALPTVIARAAQVSNTTRLDDARVAFERRCVTAALARSAGQTTRAAKELGLSRQGLTKVMKRIGVDQKNTERRRQNTECPTARSGSGEGEEK